LFADDTWMHQPQKTSLNIKIEKHKQNKARGRSLGTFALFTDNIWMHQPQKTSLNIKKKVSLIHGLERTTTRERTEMDRFLCLPVGYKLYVKNVLLSW
jgi:hypothetical protein